MILRAKIERWERLIGRGEERKSFFFKGVWRNGVDEYNEGPSVLRVVNARSETPK